MYPRHSFVSAAATEKLAEDFYDAIAKVHARFFAVRFENILDSNKPLVIYPPKGVGVNDYREALLRRTDFESPEAIVATDLSIKTQIRDAFAKEAKGASERTIGRALVNAINATSAYQINTP